MTTMPPMLQDFLPAAAVASAELPWIPSDTAGKSARPLRFLDDNRGFVELLLMQPGCVMPLHRHSGEVHAYNLSGQRKLCTGELIGPGDYVHEPAGNTDWWKIVGDEPMLALVVVYGRVEFLHGDGRVRHTVDALTQRADYERHCQARGLPVLL